MREDTIKKIIKTQARVILQLEFLLNKILETEKVLIEILKISAMTPEQEKIAQSLHFVPLQLISFGDQLNAAKDELRSLMEQLEH